MQRRRGITPTDIDGFIDYGSKVFVYFEAKLLGAPVRLGQRIALENVVKSHDIAGNRSCAIIFRHNTTPEETIVASTQFVDKSYFKLNDEYLWRTPIVEQYTVVQFLDWWETYCEKLGYIL
jgi:hypothetical protein|tara:strand:+ start:251 stop:613 length:363 start_codon:yes stop_codon:yes gene_type:complete